MVETVTEDPSAGASPSAQPVGALTSRLRIGLMRDFELAGRWVVPGRFTGVAIMGGGCIDMRNATFAEQTVRISVLALMGGIEVVVPEDAEVYAHGLGIIGCFGGRRAVGPGRAGAPVIEVTGLAIMGGIGIFRRPPKKASDREPPGDSGSGLPRDLHAGLREPGGLTGGAQPDSAPLPFTRQSNATRPVSAAESVSAGRGPLDIRVMRMSPVPSAQSVSLRKPQRGPGRSGSTL